MIFESLREKEQQATLIGVEEAHHLWELLSNRYTVIDQLNLWINFAHDNDFVYILNQHLKQFRKEAKQFEKLMNKFSLQAPDPNTVGVNEAGNFNSIRDSQAAREFLTTLRADVGGIIKVLRDSSTNDNIRAFFIQLTEKTIDKFDDFVKYLKTKNWINLPPQYPNVSPETTLKVSASEVYNLWEHLTYRYTNIHLTTVFSNFAADVDFKASMAAGNRVLTAQVGELEQRLLTIGVTLPRDFARSVKTPQSSELLSDRFMFNTLLIGMQNAAALHATAIQEAILNDDIRGFFTKLALSEINLRDTFLKFGKAKGWLFEEPKLQQ